MNVIYSHIIVIFRSSIITPYTYIFSVPMSQSQYSTLQLSPARKQRGRGGQQGNRSSGGKERRRAASPKNHEQQRQQDSQSSLQLPPSQLEQLDSDTQLPASSSAIIIPTVSTSVNGFPSQVRLIFWISNWELSKNTKKKGISNAFVNFSRNFSFRAIQFK